jgi:uncharacterized Zn finger protein
MVRKTSVSVRSLLRADVIRELALPSNLRYGTAIYKRGGVEFISVASAEVTAWVGGLKGSVAGGGSQRRRTRLFVTTDGLAWHCTGNPRKHQIFCKHCVALALAILKRRTRAR